MSQRKPRAAVLTGDGINCEVEMAHALKLAGARPDVIHITDLFAGERSLDNYQILAFPGGFHSGDDLGAGKVMANQMRYKLKGQLRAFYEDKKIIIGICNGFQALVKMGLLPAVGGVDWDSTDPKVYQQATLAANDCGRFRYRWITVARRSAISPWAKYADGIDVPIRHGEGRFLAPALLERMRAEGQVAYTYVTPNPHDTEQYPYNPNGSPGGVAAVCDPTGRIFGMMPHPEAYNHPTNHPEYFARKARGERLPEEGEGIAILRGGVDFVKEELL